MCVKRLFIVTLSVDRVFVEKHKFKCSIYISINPFILRPILNQLCIALLLIFFNKCLLYFNCFYVNTHTWKIDPFVMCFETFYSNIYCIYICIDTHCFAFSKINRNRRCKIHQILASRTFVFILAKVGHHERFSSWEWWKDLNRLAIYTYLLCLLRNTQPLKKKYSDITKIFFGMKNIHRKYPVRYILMPKQIGDTWNFLRKQHMVVLFTRRRV